MKIKRYVAKNMQEAMQKVKLDLGEDAVILHTRKFRKGGFFGFFAKEMVEVTAAIEVRLPSDGKEQQRMSAATQTAASEEVPPRNELQMTAANPMPFNLALPQHAQNINNNENPQQIPLKRKINSHTLQDQFLLELQEAYFVLLEVYDQLIENEVSETIAKNILQKVIYQLDEQQLHDAKMVKRMVQENIVQILKEPQPIKLEEGVKIISLIGPTGVGKTTTIAKLAVEYALRQQKDIALITADTYRIAAVEQLKTYGEIIGVPVETVYNKQELREAIARNLHKDLILIDTAGRSQKNAPQLMELDNLLDIDIPIEKYLVLSATTKYKDMKEIVRKFDQKDLQRIIFTKLDETNNFGCILNIISDTNKLLSYITTGQNVPEDIEVVDLRKIARMIVKEHWT